MRLDQVTDEVLEDVIPDDDERDRLRDVFENVRRRAREAIDERGIDADVELVGSAARDTWISGDRDIDVFLLLPDDLPRDDLEETGLDVGKQVFPDGVVEYAEHPYVKGHDRGYDIDLVPCYDVESATEAKTAVDRTPFHNRYVSERLEDTDDARLLKSFTKGIGVYGSELRTRGFSGYLCELLVLHYGGFEEAIEAASDWSPQVTIDIEDHGTKEFDDPLVVVDPTDPERNVAAVLSLDNFARFVHACRRLSAEPRKSLFFESNPGTVSREELEKYIEDRQTTVVCVTFESPDVVEDQLYPQLRKTESSLVDEVERRGFEVLRSDVAADDRGLILLEFNIAEQSRVERHLGPPVHVRQHAESFRSKYADADVVGPYIDDGRYVVERQRDHPTVASFVESDDFLDIGMGKHVEEKIHEGYDVYVDDDCTRLVEEFGSVFATHISPEVVE